MSIKDSTRREQSLLFRMNQTQLVDFILTNSFRVTDEEWESRIDNTPWHILPAKIFKLSPPVERRDPDFFFLKYMDLDLFKRRQQFWNFIDHEAQITYLHVPMHWKAWRLFGIRWLRKIVKTWWDRHWLLTEDLTHRVAIEILHFIYMANVENRYLTEPAECSICLSRIISGAKLNCGHEFHSKCIGEWEKNIKTCPNCRQKF